MKLFHINEFQTKSLLINFTPYVQSILDQMWFFLNRDKFDFLLMTHFDLSFSIYIHMCENSFGFQDRIRTFFDEPDIIRT